MSAEIKRSLGLDSSLDKKSADVLAAALAKNSQKGFDYIKFKQSLNQMDKLHVDEMTSVKSVFATASTFGVTKDAIVNSAKHYLSVLMNEKGQFDTALNNQVKQRIASKKDEVLKLERKIDEYRLKMAEMEKRIKEYQHKIDNADDEVEKAKNKIQLTKKKFEDTFNSFVEILEGDINRIQQDL